MKKDSTAYGAERPAWDAKDCSIRALATATGVPYQVASMTFSARGRQLKKGTSHELSTQLYEEILGMKRIELAEGLRLEAFLEVATRGRYIIHKIGHAFAVVDGIVCDWDSTSKASTRIVRAWKVTDVALSKMARIAELVA